MVRSVATLTLATSISMHERWISITNIGILVDATAYHLMLSFMNSFNDYNQIKMHQCDILKTAVQDFNGQLSLHNHAFDLKNVGTTSQRAVTTIFHDMLHNCIEDYVNDIVKVQIST